MTLSMNPSRSTTSARPDTSSLPASPSDSASASLPARLLVFAYGLACYALFLGTFLYLVGFVEGILVPKTINSGAAASWPETLAVNIGILALFAVQHTIMARAWFKRRWTKIIPAPMERSTFVLITCLILATLAWQWRPQAAVLWDVQNSIGRMAIIGLSAMGWLLVLVSTFLIDHFDLFGLRQVTLFLRKRPYQSTPFVKRSLYRWVRHPLMLGFLIAFWATPVMTEGHLLFAGVATAYILFGISVEERELIREHGAEYLDYRNATPALLPRVAGRQVST